MKIMELLKQFEDNIKIAEKDVNSGAAIRLMTVYKHVLLYLIESDKMTLTDDEEKFWSFPKTYKTSDLYKVAQVQRKRNHLPLLNYTQKNYKG